MGRLIDADGLIEIIEGNENLIEWEKEECISCVAACDTAYDVDAVVKQLEDEETQSYNDFEDYAEDHGLTEDDDWHCMGLKRAIQIVKGCSVDGN